MFMRGTEVFCGLDLIILPILTVTTTIQLQSLSESCGTKTFKINMIMVVVFGYLAIPFLLIGAAYLLLLMCRCKPQVGQAPVFPTEKKVEKL